MQVKTFFIEGLFGRLSHVIEFPIRKEDSIAPSVVILYGRNGVGKTTILRMLDGLLRLDFNIFRRIPFQRCVLEFDSGDLLTVDPTMEGEQLLHLNVAFSGIHTKLHPKHSGAADAEEIPKVEQFRKAFFKKSESVTFEFIDTERLQLQRSEDEAEEGYMAVGGTHRASTRAARNPKAKFLELPDSLAERVSRFIREAQINYRNFFSTTEADIFPKIVARLTSEQSTAYDIGILRERFEKVQRHDKLNDRLGLEPDHWDYEQMMKLLSDLENRIGAPNQHALTVLGSYLEQLESRLAERNLVADRLRTFERLMKTFWKDKAVKIHPRRGFQICLESGESLEEKHLSSGEFHLLLLMVAALGTRRKGTMIAIDEPEMSMHIEWQRRLVPALVECASKAETRAFRAPEVFAEDSPPRTKGALPGC